MIAVDGQEVRSALTLRCHTVVVGSGPAGAAVARHLAAHGVDVLVVEEGLLHERFAPDAMSAMGQLYRQMGATLTVGRAPIPCVRGIAVGGTSVINGAISWRLPEHVRAEWVDADPGLEETLDREALDRIADRVEADLGIAPTAPEVAGENDRLLARGAAALELAHRPTLRNAPGCQGSGRCLLGCPTGGKSSMDRSFLPEAVRYGARIAAGIRVHKVVLEGGAAVGVLGEGLGGGRVRVQADRVVLAASAVGTPALLLSSGLRRAPVGRHFQCHPGVSLLGRFPHPIRMWTGATQGHEVTGLVHDRIKFEALGLDLGVLATRVGGAGSAWADALRDAEHLACFAAAIRANAEGRVRRGLTGPWVSFSPGPGDVRRFRRALRVMGEMMFAAGAEWVAPGVAGFPPRVTDPRQLEQLEVSGPDDPRAFTPVITHMMGTARMGSDPRSSVVGPDFRHHDVGALYVADSSVFPSNTGVNPQTSILVLATRCAEGLVER